MEFFVFGEGLECEMLEHIVAFFGCQLQLIQVLVRDELCLRFVFRLLFVCVLVHGIRLGRC